MSQRQLLNLATVGLCVALLAGSSGIATSNATSPQGPTRAEFDALRAEVQAINTKEDQNLTRINATDSRHTTAMTDMRRDFDAERFSNLGVGDIVASALPLDRFREAHGAGSEKWVLCDGNAHPGSRYSQLAGTPNVPDLQGRYPRGWRPGFTLRGQQESAVADHHHLLLGKDDGSMNTAWDVMGDAQGGGDNAVARWGQGGGGVKTAGVAGRDNSETRPPTTIVMFYIRID